MDVAKHIARAVEIIGSQKKLGAAIGRSQNWVSLGVNGHIDDIPVRVAFAIERATGGVVRAEDFARPAPAPAATASPEPSPASEDAA